MKVIYLTSAIDNCMTIINVDSIEAFQLKTITKGKEKINIVRIYTTSYTFDVLETIENILGEIKNSK